MKKVIVVGGGAAGMIAAIASAQIGNQVTIIEKNEKLGKKIFITGKGRCNVTKACEIEDLFKNIISNPKFMYSAIYGFDNHAIMDFFENNGCHLKTERGDRVFPVTDHSSDIIQTLQNVIKKLKITLLLNTKVDKIITEDNLVNGVFVNKNEKIEADAVIIATGGKSYPLTGSTGDGYELARNLGHSITKLSPALVPMQIEEDFCIRLQGLSLKNVNATIEINDL
ncbi:MAG: aminoacetone oxidase family FAD-binding enzyme [Clostridiales bacterium]|nr:aminoacetone oxidase family FAD-binding enzyme [Clostridiales bacterium]